MYVRKRSEHDDDLYKPRNVGIAKNCKIEFPITVYLTQRVGGEKNTVSKKSLQSLGIHDPGRLAGNRSGSSLCLTATGRMASDE